MRSTRAVAVITQAMSPDCIHPTVSEPPQIEALGQVHKAHLIVDVDILSEGITTGLNAAVTSIRDKDSIVERIEIDGSNTVRHLDDFYAQAKRRKRKGCTSTVNRRA